MKIAQKAHNPEVSVSNPTPLTSEKSSKEGLLLLRSLLPIKIYSFSHLTGEHRGKLAQELWEAQAKMQLKGITASSEEAKLILAEALEKWGIEASSNK